MDSALLSVGESSWEARRDNSGSGRSHERLLLWRKFWKHTPPYLLESGGILPASRAQAGKMPALLLSGRLNRASGRFV